MMKDTYHSMNGVFGLETIVVNDDTEGTGALIDLAGYNSATLFVLMGASGDTLSGSVKHSLVLHHGDASDGSDLAAVDEADIIGAISGTTTGAFALVDDPAEDSAVFKAGYIGSKRYVKFKDDTTGTHTNGTPLAAIWVLSHAYHEPVS